MTWRSVSLLCSEYKFSFKGVGNQAEHIIEREIQCDQTYLLDRLISAIILIHDFIETCKLFGLKAGIIAVDWKKLMAHLECLWYLSWYY